MRFDRLNIPAFGPFTSCSCDFPKSSQDLHVIYGANEAGKSSLLRGIHHLLYGFPNSTDDDFLHDYKKLLIGATVSHGNERLTFYRKKGKVGTLLDANQSSIDEGRLKAFCGSVSPEFFSHMFGLGTDTLRSGAESLLSAQGELGALLFAASAGGSPIESALQNLQAEADSLFAGNGRKGNAIVAAYTAVKQHEKDIREHTISTSQWDKLSNEITAAQSVFDHKDKNFAERRMRQRVVENLITAIPLINKTKALESQLAEITLPNVGTDFADRVATAKAELVNAQASISENTASLESLQTRLADITPFETIVQDGPELDSLHQAITQHLAEIATRDEAGVTLTQLEAEQLRQLKKLGIETREQLAALPEVETEKISDMQTLAEMLTDAERERNHAKTALQETITEINKQQNKLDSLGESETNALLRELSLRIEDHNQNKKVAEGWRKDRDTNKASLHSLTTQLGVTDLSIEQIRKLPVPQSAVVDDFNDKNQRLEKATADTQKRLDDHKASALEIQAQIKMVSEGIAVVSKDELFAARTARDEHWNLIENKLQKQEPVDDDELKSFANKILESDKVADSLRYHAEGLGKLASLHHRLDSTSANITLTEETLQRFEEERKTLESEWFRHANFLPQRCFLPHELLDWRSIWKEWCVTESEISILDSNLNAYHENRDELATELRQHFQVSDGSYQLLATQLGETLKNLESINGQRKVITELLESLRSNVTSQTEGLSSAEQRVEQLNSQWSKSVASLNLEHDSSRDAVLNVIARRHRAHETDREITKSTQQLESLRERIGVYQEKLESYRKKHLPDAPVLDPLNPDVAEKRMSEHLAAAKTRKTESAALARNIQQVTDTIRTKQKAIESAEAELANLVAEAGVESKDHLADAVEQYLKRASLLESLEVNTSTLTNLAGASTVAELLEQANSEDWDALQLERENLSAQIMALQTERDVAREALNEALKRRSDLESANDDAALAKQFSANEMANVITHSERFIRLHHSISFLRQQVEDYRKKSQGPMVEKTSQFFRTLTNGSFSGVAAQQAEDDPNQINLVALRKSLQENESMPKALPTQALSEGTRDQLYLALRMAAIDLHLDHHAPMPLILDDVLMTFDDARANAFFELMKTLSEKTQVIVFTHHQHTARMAEKFVPTEQVMTLSPTMKAV